MKKVIPYILGLAIVLTSCTSEKPEETKKAEIPNPFSENTLLLLTPTTDPNYCSPDSIVAGDCGMGDLYVTKDGKVLYSPYCMGMDSLTYYIGNYAVSDTAIVCSFTSEYSHWLGCQGCPEEEAHPVDPNAGTLKNSSSLTLILKKTNCKDFPYYLANSQDMYPQALKLENDQNNYCKMVSEIKALSKFHCAYTESKATEQ